MRKSAAAFNSSFMAAFSKAQINPSSTAPKPSASQREQILRKQNSSHPLQAVELVKLTKEDTDYYWVRIVDRADGTIVHAFAAHNASDPEAARKLFGKVLAGRID